ncbi:MAG: RpiB/LacA/LacB family sugar-phosphate isomerase [Acidobacteriaceae bacterium]|nr:RpiB/LacA/LacB family sugar-phosphate isomerase [Acidobacteriaceae bacterium]
MDSEMPSVLAVPPEKGYVYIASDHNGTACRNYLVKRLVEAGYAVIDLGPDEYEGKVDYPLMAKKLCENVLDEHRGRGVLICGTGTGMLIAANRFKGIRAGLATDRATAELMRQHNDCNVIVLGQWRTPMSEMETLVKTFLETPFEQGRHVKRVEMLEKLGEE